MVDASVILCTRDRAARLAETLARFEELRSAAQWELILVDNGSGDATPELLAAFAARTSLSVKLVHEARGGLAMARNAGMRVSGGAILLFTDDDCYPAPDWIDAWRAVFAGQGLDFGCGRVELFDPDDAKVAIRTDSVPEDLSPQAFVRAGWLHGANMAFRRGVYEALGGFSPLFGAGSRYRAGDDLEFAQRASRHGFALGYRPEPMVWHHHGRKPNAIGKRRTDYEFARGALYLRTWLAAPLCIPRHVRGRIRADGSLLMFARRFYWAERHDFWRIKFDVARGMAAYARRAWRRDHRL